MKIQITKGEWKIGYSSIASLPQIEISIEGHRIANLPLPERFMGKSTNPEIDEAQEANAKLIVDAGTTANKCGLLPSELLEQRNELLKALENAFELLNKSYNDGEKPNFIDLRNLEETIKKATKN